MANIKLNNIEYQISDSTLAAPTADLIAHLQTIEGEGLRVVVGGVEYNVDPNKVAGAIADLEGALSELENNGGGSDTPDEDLSVDPATGEILDSWEVIINNINNGTYATKYTVGNYKPLDLGSEGVVNMQIAALDADILSDGTGNAHITWVAKELLATTRGMNTTNTNSNGWVSSGMRRYLRNDIWALIPATVQNAIVEVDKTYYNYTTTSTETYSDTVWIPSCREVQLKNANTEDSGVIYNGLFTSDNNTRIKTLNGTPKNWWLRSASSRSNTNFYAAGYTGHTVEGLAKESSGVALCFCM